MAIEIMRLLKDPVTKFTVMGIANVIRLAGDLGITLPEDFEQTYEARLGDVFIGGRHYRFVVTPVSDGAKIVAYDFAYNRYDLKAD